MARVAQAQPAPAPTEPVAAPPIAPPPEPEPPSSGAVEVTIEGERVPDNATTLSRRDIREMPGVLGDPFRVIEIAPSVTPTVSGFPYFFIRGAPPSNVGYYFDGIQVPLLFHVGGGPSVIPPALVQRVDLHLGPYPARFGRLAGAVVEAEITPPPYDWRGEASVRLGDLAAHLEGPARDDLTVFVAGRWAAGVALITALVPSVDLNYGDYQARATYEPRKGDRLSIFAFGAKDYLAAAIDGDEPEVLLDSDFHRLDLRYGHDIEGGVVDTAVTLGVDQSRGLGGVERARDWKLGARASVVRQVSPRAILRGGLDVALDAYEVEHGGEGGTGGIFPDASEGQLDDAFSDLFQSRLDMTVGAWAEATLALDQRATLTPGLRVDHHRSMGETALAVDPKLVGSFGIGEHLRLIPAVGMASQRPGFLPVPALQIAGIPGGLQRSLQTSFGAEVKVGPLELGGTVFRQATFGLTDALGTGRGTELSSSRFLARSLGDAYGVEIGARGALRRDLLFMFSYTLSRTTRERDGFKIPSAFDRTHVLHTALLYDLGRGWRAGVRHMFYTGFPADEAAVGRVTNEHPDRVRPFYRFDVRVSKRWRIGEHGYLSLILDLQNATLSREIIDVTCDAGGCSPRVFGPITLPALGLEAGF
ncbi:TonB-dependent receptor plug domain-containing protein [Chondromyces apiculatus]|uniref:TonB-dependent receptor plug domain-containing protein n=1 Tax=Chondromyces apiculatus TaxID=51 RepID=UPI001E4CB6BD|nr:TonB-dependent receptor [Chondromyces apiculatus]